MAMLFPGYYTINRLDAIFHYVDFKRWMMWNQDACHYSEAHWHVFPLSIRIRLVRKGYLSYNIPLPLSNTEDEADIATANREPMSVNGILSGGGYINGMLMANADWQLMFDNVLGLEELVGIPARSCLVRLDDVAPLGAYLVDNDGRV